MSAPLLAYQQVVFRYNTQNGPVLQDLSLEIQSGSITAILGPNGAGKTTLLHLALGLIHPQAGQIALAGRPLETFARRELGQWIGLVPQSEHTPFEFSMLEYVLLGRAPYLQPLAMPGEQDVRIAQEMICQVGLEKLAHRAITRLSGGERQLMLVARALAQQPRLLLMDEPTSNLDLGNKARLLGLLKSLAAQGVTVVLTTHEPEVAASVATHLVLMKRGSLYLAGPLPQVLTGAHLSAIYGIPIEVQSAAGRPVILWQADGP